MGYTSQFILFDEFNWGYVGHSKEKLMRDLSELGDGVNVIAGFYGMILVETDGWSCLAAVEQFEGLIYDQVFVRHQDQSSFRDITEELNREREILKAERKEERKKKRCLEMKNKLKEIRLYRPKDYKNWVVEVRGENHEGRAIDGATRFWEGGLDPDESEGQLLPPDINELFAAIRGAYKEFGLPIDIEEEKREE